MTTDSSGRLDGLVVVERVIAGNRPGRPITEAERREVARRMLARGNTTNEIAHALRSRFKRAQALVAVVPRGGTETRGHMVW